MKLQIVRVADRGVPSQERLHLSVVVDTTLSFYVVLKSTIVGVESVASGNLLAYWFPTIQVKAGDTVVVYTGGGTNTNSRDTVGHTTHFLYWGLNHTIWNNPADCAVIVEGTEWSTGK